MTTIAAIAGAGNIRRISGMLAATALRKRFGFAVTAEPQKTALRIPPTQPGLEYVADRPKRTVGIRFVQLGRKNVEGR